jgi:hypothetical protein
MLDSFRESCRPRTDVTTGEKTVDLVQSRDDRDRVQPGLPIESAYDYRSGTTKSNDFHKISVKLEM